MRPAARPLTGLAALFALTSLAGAAAPGPLTSAQIRAQMQSFQAQTGVPGMAVAVMQGGQVTVETLGAAPQTRFKLASLSKSFTALTVLRLAEAGKLNLDRPVSTILPLTWKDPRGAAITVRHLLHQTSGLSDGAAGQVLTSTFTPPAKLLHDIADSSLSAPAGERYEYANVNYVLLALLAEQVSGQPYRDVLRAEVLRPLNIGAEVVQDCAEQPPGSAPGHTLLLRWALPAAEPHSNCVGSGDVVASAQEMGRWLQAHFSDGAGGLSPSERALLHGTDGPGGYGMGWYRIEQPDLPPYLGHGGNLVTSATHMVYDASTRTGVAVLLDTNGPAALLTLNLLRQRHGLGPVPMRSPSLTMDAALLGLLALSVLWAGWHLSRLRRWKAWAAAAPRWRVWLSLGVLLVLLPLAALAPTLIFGASVQSWPVVMTLLPSSAALWGVAVLVTALRVGRR